MTAVSERHDLAFPDRRLGVPRCHHATSVSSRFRDGWRAWNDRAESTLERGFERAFGLPSESGDFSAYARRMTARMWGMFGLACIVLNLTFWGMDPIIFRDSHHTWAIFTLWRVGFLGCATAAYFGLRRIVARDGSPFPLTTAIILGFSAFTYRLFSELGGPARPWGHTGATFPLATILFVVPLLPRLGLALATATVVLVSYFAPYPVYLGEPFALSLIPMTYGCALLGTIAGHAFYVLLRKTFEQHRELTRLAYVDVLTNVANRARFLELAQTEVDRARRYGRPLSVLILDVDHFKAVNDTFGHAVGDAVLRALADALGRLGGEEFGVVLPETDASQASSLGERLRIAANEVRVTVPSSDSDARAEAGCTVTVGGSEIRLGREELRELLVRADAALYEGKRAGRDRVVVS